jgi:hypothetical protein
MYVLHAPAIRTATWVPIESMFVAIEASRIRLCPFRLILLPHSAPADYLQPGRTQDITRTNSATLGK